MSDCNFTSSALASFVHISKDNLKTNYCANNIMTKHVIMCIRLSLFVVLKFDL